MERNTILPEERLAYSVNDAAALISISRAKLYELMNAGEIRFRKIGARRVLTREAIVEFLDSES